MGCDIHLIIEQFDNDTGKWELHPECKVEREAPDPKDPTDTGYMTISGPYHGRNYALFSRLADVRNDSGIEPIARPKGIPPDATVEYLEWVDRWGVDGHSHSFFTLSELENAFDGVYPEAGIVSEKEYIRMLMTGSPQSWSGGIGGADVEIIQPYQFLDLFTEESFFVPADARGTSKRDPKKRYYIQASWFNSWTETAREFRESVIYKMRSATWTSGQGEDGRWQRKELRTPDQVRCVFFFDN